VRLADTLLRRGHLSERTLVETLMTGDRPGHLDRCDLCARRAVELGRWLDDLKAVGLEEADRVFPPERLALQQAQILRRLEQLDEPSRIIAFPSQYQLEPRGMGRRRVAPAWVGVAAAAGVVLGVIGGQISARAGLTAANAPSAPQPAAVTTPAAVPASGVPSNAAFRQNSLLELNLENGTSPALDALNEMTPSMTPNLVLASTTRGGG
jgi:hypothetical protein